MQNSPWQQQLKNTVNNIQELCSELDLDYNTLKHGRLNLQPKFPLKVSRYYLNKINKNNLNDPLLLQILPQVEELKSAPNFCHDPLEEEKYTKVPGLIHKYHNRVLLTVTGACGIHCRYCFRQNFPYENNILAQKERDLQLDYIIKNININEVILSGGDPLCVNNKYLDLLLSSLTSIPHIKTIRFHSRMPIVIPDRIDEELIEILNRYINNQHVNIVLVTHCNHPDELDEHIKNKMALLKNIGITILNQSVLLKNINDNAKTLVDLSHKLFECHILPYYLHLLDPVTGTSHYEVKHSNAKLLIKEVSSKLSGYLVPKLVQEIAGMPSKTLVPNLIN